MKDLKRNTCSNCGKLLFLGFFVKGKIKIKCNKCKCVNDIDRE